MRGLWKVLDPDSSSTISPPLVVKYEVANSAYTIHVSDLTHVWTERMNARDIRKRALNSDTSIDPSEDYEQMRLFLRCIIDALERKQGTSVQVAYDESADRLLLKTFTPLPGSLEPLRWTVELTKESPLNFSKEMVLPLLYQQATRNAECASLIKQLKDKDHVIDKLIDTIQADGISLSKIFPGAAPLKSGSKLDPRQALSKSVKGLSTFDEQEWRRNLKHHTAQQSSLGGVISTVFQLGAYHDEEVLLLPDYGEWWLGLNRKRLHEAQDYSTLHPPQEESQASKGGSQFQRQVTPPTLRRTAPEHVSEQTPEASARLMNIEKRQTTSTKRDLDDSTTEDEDDLAVSKTHGSTESVSKNYRSRHETIDNSLSSRPKEDANAPAKPTADFPDPEARSSSHVEDTIVSNANHNPTPSKPKAKIGRIGGKPKPKPKPALSPPLDPPQPTTRTKEQPNFAQHQESQHQNPNPTLTVQTHPTAPSPAEGVPPILTKRASPSPSPTPAETEIERADRNRAQIKRALEAKAAAPATKKKRRF